MQINSDNSKVNANALERIAELEAALRDIIEYKCVVGKHRDYDQEAFEHTEIAKKALGDCNPDATQ
jgi:hypothetical protein